MTEKPHAGRWPKGKSGNPRGRRPGSGKIAELRQSIETRLPPIITALIDRAEQGDIQAARLLLERTIAPLKAIEATAAFALPNGKSLSAQADALIEAVAAGKVAPGAGAALMGSLALACRIREVDELEARIRRLEGGTDAD